MKASGQFSLFRFCLLMLMLVSYTDTYVFSKPRGGQVVSGTASFTQDGNLTVITASNRSIINYQGFDIGKGETVQFVQPGAHATVLNRVLTPDPTNIFGSLQSNGIVIITNPYGVFFQNGSVVNVGGLVAGAGKISDADFSAGKIHFTDLTGDVRNDGIIAADNRIALMGANVVNTGSMTAAHGMAMMVSGPDVYVGEKNGNIFVQANGKALRAAAAATGATAASAGSITNSGTVAAPRVVLGAGDMYSTAIVNSGLLQGRSIAVNAGKGGSATVGGTLDANSAHNPTATGKGGNINVLGGTVALKGATLDASGGVGGGNVRVGGDFHGASTLATAATTTADAATTIKADATGAAGNGGTVVLWSEKATDFSGQITARAGTASGDGGQVEISSHGGLGYNGLVNAGTTTGKPGSLLLDPLNIEISSTSGSTTGGQTVAPGDAPAAGTLTISAFAIEHTDPSTAISLQATQDFKIDTLATYSLVAPTNIYGVQTAGQLTFPAPVSTVAVPPAVSTPIITPITLAAGVGGQGSFVMATTTDTLATNGRPITITASGVTATGGINTGITNAIQIGKINTSPGGTATAAGSVVINDTAAIPATNPPATAPSFPVSVNNITATSATGAGGSISIAPQSATVAGGVTTSYYAPTSITTGGLATSTTTANGGVGGGIVLGTSGNATVGGAIATGTASNTAAGNVAIYAGGDVALQSTVNTATTANPSGKGGDITIGDTTVYVPTSVGVTGAVTTSTGGTGNSGNVAVTSTGNITFGGLLNTGATNGAGGNVNLLTAGTVSLAGVTTSGNGNAGSITVDKSTGVVPSLISSTASLLATSTAGNGGPVTLTTSGNLTVTATPASQAINTSGGGTGTGGGGQVNLVNGGVLTPGTITTSGNNGTSGNVTLASGGSMALSAITTTSSAGNGGNVLVVLNTGTTTPGTLTLPGISTGGNLATSGTITATNDNLTGDTIATNGTLNTTGTGNAVGGSVTLSAPIITLSNPITANGAGTGTGGAVSLDGSGTFAATTTTAFNLGSTISGRSLTTGAGTTTFNNGSGVTTSGGGQTYGGPAVLNQAAAGKLTTVSDSSTGNITFDSTVASATGNTGQSLTITTGGAVALDSTVNLSSATGAGGSLLVGTTGTAPTSISIGNSSNTDPAVSALTTAATGTTMGNTGAGGTVTLKTSGAISIYGSTDTSSAGAAGGNVSLTSTGDNVGTGNIVANGATGGGTVLASTTGTLFVGSINSSATTGAGGTITLGQSGATPSSVSVGTLTSTGSTTGGNVAIRSGGNTNVGVVQAYGVTGGSFTALTAANNTTATGTFAAIDTHGTTGAAGAVSIGTDGSTTNFAPAHLALNGVITANSTTGTGGAVALKSGNEISGGANIDASTSTTTGGMGGSISATGNGAVTLGVLNASGYTVGGPIGLAAGSGALGLTSANTSSGDGAAGNITLGGTGITVSGTGTGAGTLTATGGQGNGGTIAATSNGGITVSSAISTAAFGTGGTGGGVSLLTGTTPGAVSVQGITTTSSGTGNAGSITIDKTATGTVPTSITLGGALLANATNTGGGAGGVVSLATSGAISGGGTTGQAINSSSASASGGLISAVSSGGAVTLGALTSSGVAAGNGGDVTVTSGGTGNALSVGAITASTTTSGHGGAVSLTSTGTLGAGAINTSTTGSGVGGNVTAKADGSLTISGAINTSSTGAGAGGNVILLTEATGASPLTPVTTLGINTSSGSGTGGSITIEHDSATSNAQPPTSITINGPLNTTGATNGPILLESSGVVTLASTSSAGRFSFTGDTSITGNSLVITYNGTAVTTPTFDLQNHNLTLDIATGVTVDGSMNGTTGKFDNVNNFVIAAGAGLTTFDGNFATEGSQTYSGNGETLTADTVLHAGVTDATGALTFNAAGAFGFNDNASFAHNLTLVTGTASTGMTTTGVTISQPFGTVAPFLSLTATNRQTGQTTDSSESVTINAQTVAAGTQNYYTLALGGTGATALTSTLANGSITATGAVTASNGQAFNVNATGTNGATTFKAIGTAANPVGATDFEVAGLATFTDVISAASFALGKTTVGTEGLFGTSAGPITVTTTAGQTYGEPVYLGAATTLTDTGGNNITLALVRSQTATAEPLTVNTSGLTTFGGTVGAGGFPLLSVTTDANGTTQLNGGSVTTTSAAGQMYNDAVTLGVTGTNPSTTLTAGNGAVTFGKTLESVGTPQALTISTTGVTTFTGEVGGTPSTATTAATDAVTTAPALASLTTVTTGAVGTGIVHINGGSVTTVTAPVPGGATGAQSYGGPVVIGGPTLFKGYSLAFTRGISSDTTVAGNPFDLTLDLFGVVTLPGSLSLTGILDLLSEGPGEVRLNGTVTTLGSQAYINGPITLTGDTTLQAGTTVATAGITLGSTTIVTALNNATVGGPYNLTLISGTGMGAGVTINESIGATTPIASLTATGRTTNNSTPTTDEPVTINTTDATTIKTVGSQAYGSLILTGTGLPTLASTGTGAGVGITVNGAVTGNGVGLTANVASPTGSSSFGAITNGGALSFTLGGTAILKGAVTATSLTVTGGTSVTLAAGTMAVPVGTITTTGEQNYNESVILGTAMQLSGQGTGLGTTGSNGVALNFSQTITGDFALTLSNTANATAGGLSNTIFGGAVGTLASLSTSTVGTTFINGGSITTDGAAGQVYNGPVVLGATGMMPTTTLAAGTGPVNFINATASVVSAPSTLQALVINTSGLTTFEGAVGGAPDATTTAVTTSPALASLTTLGGGTVDINGGSVTTVTAVTGTATGAQSYSGQVVLTGDATLKGNTLSLASGAAGGLVGGGFNLTLNFASQITLPSGIAGVNNFMSVGPGGVLLNGMLATTGDQIYSNGTLTLSGAAGLTSTAGNLVFNTPIIGGGSLALNAPGTAAGTGQAIFNANALVGSSTAFIGAFTSNTTHGTILNINAGASATGSGGFNASSVAITGPVTFNEAGSTTANNIHPSILTTGPQTYNGPVTLTLNTSLVSNGAGAITFNPLATVDSAAPGSLSALNLSTTGNQTFGGLVGSVNALSGLTTGTGTTFFNMTIPAGSSTVQAGVLVNGPVTTGGPASFAVTNSSLAQPSVLTLGNGAQTYGTATTPPGTAITLAGPVTVLNSANSVSGGVFTGGGTITINGNIVAGVANPELDIRAGAGTTVFDGSVYTSGDFAPGGASVVFNGSVGTAAAPVGVFTVLPNNGGIITPMVDLNGGTYVTAGSFMFTLPTLLSANTILQAGGNATFNNTINGNNPLSPYSLTVNLNGGTAFFNGVVGGTIPLASLTIGNVGATLGTTRFGMDLSGLGANQGGVNVLGAVTINTNADFEASSATVPTILSGVTYNGFVGTGTQTYGQSGSAAAVTLGQNTILRDLATPGGITFNGNVNAAVDGGASLSVNAVGDESFNQLVGNNFRLASLTADNFGTVGGSTRFNMNLTPAGTVGGVRVAGPVTINDAVVFNTTGGFTLPTILSGGAQTYALAATVNQNAVLTAASGDIVFANTVNSGATAQTLQVNTPGNEVFRGLVGFTSPLANLLTDAAGTVGGQTQFVMTKPAVGATGSNLGGVNVSGNIVVNDGVLFQVGGTQATGAAFDPSVVTGGSQTYNGPVTLGNQTLLTSSTGNIAFNSTVDSVSPTAPQQLTLLTSAAGSAITFAAPVGGINALASLLTQGSGTTRINGGSITTTGEQRFDNAVTLGQDTVLRSTGTSDITFNNSLDGSHNLEVDANTANFRSVGLGAPLLNLTVNAPTLTSFFYAATTGSTSVNLAGRLTVNGPASFLAGGAGGVAFVRTGLALSGVNIPSGQDYNGPFTLQGTASFNDFNRGDITFAQAVDGVAFATYLTVGTGGTISFLAPVGATTPLGGLLLDNLNLATGRAVLSGGSITTLGVQTFNDAVFLNAGTTLTSTAGGAISFNLTLDSLTAAAPQTLLVNTSGQTIFNGAVGAANALASLTTDSEGPADAGTFLNGGSITTTGTQLFNDAVFLGADTTLTSTAGGDLHFAQTLLSDATATPRALTLNTAGGTIFDGQVGSIFYALASLTTDDEGAADLGTFLNGGRVTTVGAQTYNDGVTLGARAVLASTANGALTFNNRVNGAFDLTLNTGGQTIFNGRIGNVTPLASLTTDNAGAAGEATQFNMTVTANSTAGVVVNGPVTINDGVFLNVKGASLAQPGILTVGNGTQTYNGPVTLGTSTFLTSAAALPAAGAAFTGGGAILFASPQGIVSAGGSDLFVRAGVGATTFGSTINAQNLDLGGALVTFAGPINLTGTLSVEPNDNTAGGSITFNGGSLTTVGGQTYNVPLVLGADTFLTSTGGGDIRFVTTLDGAHNLTLDTTGDEIFGGQVGGVTPLLSLTTDDPRFSTPGGHVIFDFAGGTTASPSVTTVGAQVYNDAAILGANTVLASTGSGITFAQTVDSDAAATPRALTLNAAGDETFNARVGGTNALLSLITDDPAGTVSGGHVIFNIPGSTTALPGVTTTAFQTYNDAVILALDTVLASTGGGALAFASTVDSATATAPRFLTLDTAGNEIFGGQVGGTNALLSVTTDDPAANTTGGQMIFAYAGTGRSVVTTGFQTYNDAVTLQAATTLASSTLTFASTVDGAYALTLNTTGTTTFQGAVGGGTALASLTTKTGPVAFNGRTVTTTGLQTYGGAATLGVDTVLTSTAAGGGITFASTVDSDAAATPRALTLNAVGDETFNGRVGSGAALASLTTDDPAAGVSGGRVVFNIGGSSATVPGVITTGAQTYNDAAMLGLDTVLASTGGGTLTFASTVDGAYNLTLDSRGDEIFGGTVGGKDALLSLTTDDPAGNLLGGRVIFGSGATTTLAVTTTGAQTYSDAVLLQADTKLTSTSSGTLTFGSTIDGAQALTLNSAGDENFNGQIGNQIALTSLATDADPANSGGSVNFYFDGHDATSVTTTGFQTYGDAVTLRADTTLSSTGGRGLTFNSAVDGNNVTSPRALTLLTNGNTTFNAVVGSLKALGDLTIGSAAVSGGQTVFNMNVGTRPKGATNLAGVNVTGTVAVNNAVVFNTQGSGTASPTIQATGSQRYNGAITLKTDTVLASTGATATLTLNSTVDGAANLTLSTPGTTILNGAIGSAPNGALASLAITGGPATLNGGTITTTGAQAYSGAVTLTNDTTLTSQGDGITFGSTVDGEQNLTLDTAGATSFDGAVGSMNPLLTLLATDGSGVILNGADVTTHGLQTYGGSLDINGADGGKTTLQALNDRSNLDGSLIFKQNVTVNSGSLLVQGRRILAEANSNMTVAGAGDLDLEASDVLILRGTSYGSGSGKLTLNDPGDGATPDPVQRATILLTNAKTLLHGGNFDMGYLQNLYSLGALTISVPGGNAKLSDIAASNSLTVTAATITLRARAADSARGGKNGTGGTDDGLNFVANNSINFGQSPISYDNSHVTNDVANFVTTTGNVTVNRDQANGVSLFQDPSLPVFFAQNNPNNFNDADFDSFLLPFQPISGGTQTIDTAAALSGALPDQKPLDVATDITISASQLEELLKLGIHPRKAQRQERLSLASKRALFAQLVDGLDKDNYGMLQPIKGGISRLVPSDYVVVVDRMSEHEVQAILTAFEQLYGKNKEKAPPIGEAFNSAFTDYTAEKQTADPAGFAPYIASKPGKYPDIDKAVRGFDNLFGYIESLGLTEKEQAKAKEHIASDLQVAGVSPEDMAKVIDTLRTKIPKNEKAASTKLPPSPPASNPAPGATNPPPPEQKKGTPPLKTAGETLPSQDDRLQEVAGL